jgi:hypothetical protein
MPWRSYKVCTSLTAKRTALQSWQQAMLAKAPIVACGQDFPARPVSVPLPADRPGFRILEYCGWFDDLEGNFVLRHDGQTSILRPCDKDGKAKLCINIEGSYISPTMLSSARIWPLRLRCCDAWRRWSLKQQPCTNMCSSLRYQPSPKLRARISHGCFM